ncbi:MAG: hypothetical protein JWR19_135 [Pedosphaera sp.]|nr:hypothetical protein [Pedosphaera sp.]
MALLVNIRHLEEDAVQLEGELPVAELDMESIDELIHLKQPLLYDLEVQKVDHSFLATGSLELTLECECVRCLKPFDYRLELPNWAVHLPLEGEDRVAISNDCVDLTPYIREDILLEFPQHPLCKAECGGLPKKAAGKKKKSSSSGAGQTKDVSSAWADLNKLKF